MTLETKMKNINPQQPKETKLYDGPTDDELRNIEDELDELMDL